MYIPTFNMCMDIASKEEEYTPGKFYLASEFNLDMAGTLAGTCPSSSRGIRSPRRRCGASRRTCRSSSGAMTTAGGLVFYGNQHG